MGGEWSGLERGRSGYRKANQSVIETETETASQKAFRNGHRKWGAQVPFGRVQRWWPHLLLGDRKLTRIFRRPTLLVLALLRARLRFWLWFWWIIKRVSDAEAWSSSSSSCRATKATFVNVCGLGVLAGDLLYFFTFAFLFWLCLNKRSNEHRNECAPHDKYVKFLLKLSSICCQFLTTSAQRKLCPLTLCQVVFPLASVGYFLLGDDGTRRNWTFPKHIFSSLCLINILDYSVLIVVAKLKANLAFQYF